MKMKICAAICATTMLAACAGTPTPIVTVPPIAVPGITAAELAAIIAQAQAYTVEACAYEPDAKSVAQIVATFYAPSVIPVAIASQVADAICGSVTAKSLHRGSHSLPRVHGIPVRGYFVS